MTLTFPYTFGEDAESRPFGDGLTSQIIRSGLPLLINEDFDASRARLGVQPIGAQAASYLGVPIPATILEGVDSLLSIIQMPKGVPVATFAIGKAGAANAGLFAVAMLANHDAALREKLRAWRAARRDEVLTQVVGQK